MFGLSLYCKKVFLLKNLLNPFNHYIHKEKKSETNKLYGGSNCKEVFIR